jgi:hypothetical protein
MTCVNVLSKVVCALLLLLSVKKTSMVALHFPEVLRSASKPVKTRVTICLAAVLCVQALPDNMHHPARFARI